MLKLVPGFKFYHLINSVSQLFTLAKFTLLSQRALSFSLFNLLSKLSTNIPVKHSPPIKTLENNVLFQL